MSPLVGWIASLLLHATWIAAFAALAVWVLLRWVRDPRIVHGVTAGGLLLIASALLAVGVATWPRMSERMVVTVPVAVTSAPPQIQSMHMPPVAAAGPVVISAPAPPDWRAWTVLAWCCGVMAMSLRHFGGWWRALWLRRTATRITGELHDRLTAFCRTIGAAVPLLLASTRLAVPSAIGWWRPAILIPAGLLTGLPPAQLDALILHELAHLRRHDWLIEIAVSVLECLLFFHPAVWWLGRRLRQAREQCCDGYAVRAGAEPSGLARALLALAERTAPGSPALAATGGALADRVRRILGLPEQRQRPWRALVAIAMLPVVLVVVTACATAARNESAKIEPKIPEVPTVGGAPQAFSLARRIRAKADGRQVATSLRVVAASPEYWRGLGIDGVGPVRLHRAEAIRVLNTVVSDASDAEKQVRIVSSPNITTNALQRANASFINQFAYISDYRLLDGHPDPVISVLSHGSVFEICAEAVADGVIVADARMVETQHIGAEVAQFPWRTNDAETMFPFESPVVLMQEGRVPSGTILASREAIAVPLTKRIQRTGPTFPSALEYGTVTSRVADPDLQTYPQLMGFITAEVIGEKAEILLATAEAGHWLDGVRIDLDVHDVPMDEALTKCAAQLPVPVEVARDADYLATRVSLTARGESARKVLNRLLEQSLLDGVATAGLLRLSGNPVRDFPATDLTTAAGSSKQQMPIVHEQAIDKTFDTLPGPAWDKPILRLYDVNDLLLGPKWQNGTSDGWAYSVDISKSNVLFSDVERLAEFLRQTICTSTWDEVRSLDARTGTLFVRCAPAVHRAIEAVLMARRTAVNVQLIIRLLRPDAGAVQNLSTNGWYPFTESDMFRPDASALQDASNQVSHGRIARDARQLDVLLASATEVYPGTLEIFTSEGSSAIVSPTKTSSWSGMQFAATPVLSQDHKSITLRLVAERTVDGKSIYQAVRQRIPDTGAMLLDLNDGSVLMVQAVVVHPDLSP